MTYSPFWDFVANSGASAGTFADHGKSVYLILQLRDVGITLFGVIQKPLDQVTFVLCERSV